MLGRSLVTRPLVFQLRGARPSTDVESLTAMTPVAKAALDGATPGGTVSQRRRPMASGPSRGGKGGKGGMGEGRCAALRRISDCWHWRRGDGGAGRGAKACPPRGWIRPIRPPAALPISPPSQMWEETREGEICSSASQSPDFGSHPSLPPTPSRPSADLPPKVAHRPPPTPRRCDERSCLPSL